MTRSFAQNEPVFAATCCSSARRVRSDHYLCQPPCVVHPGSPSDKLPKNPYNNARCGTLLESAPKAFDNFSHCGRQSHRRRPDELADKAQSRPIACWFFSRQTTKVHPTPVSFAQAHQAQVRATSHSRAGVRRLFFEPGAYRVTGDAESSRQAPQRRAFFVGAENLLAFGVAIANRLRIVTTAAKAVFTVIALFAIAGQAVAKQIFTAAMTTFNGDCNHRLRLSPLTLLSHYPIINSHRRAIARTCKDGCDIARAPEERWISS